MASSNPFKNQEIIKNLRSKSKVALPWCDEFEKMISGMNFSTSKSEEMKTHRLQTLKYIHQLNTIPITESTTLLSLRAARIEIGKKFLGGLGERSYFEQGFNVQWGCNLFIGEQCYINRDCSIFDDAPVTIGNNVLIGPSAILCTSTHEVDPVIRKTTQGCHAFPIVIEDDVWIGARVTVLPGVRIGKGSLVAAGCVVNKDVPRGVLVAGVPGRVLKALKEEGKEGMGGGKRVGGLRGWVWGYIGA